MTYIFPENKRAAENTVSQQMIKITEEVGELAQALAKGEPNKHVIEEANDVICAVEQLKRKLCCDDENASSIAYVIAKGNTRGDWL